jgi:hypothetical protein
LMSRSGNSRMAGMGATTELDVPGIITEKRQSP